MTSPKLCNEVGLCEDTVKKIAEYSTPPVCRFLSRFCAFPKETFRKAFTFTVIHLFYCDRVLELKQTLNIKTNICDCRRVKNGIDCAIKLMLQDAESKPIPRDFLLLSVTQYTILTLFYTRNSMTKTQRAALICVADEIPEDIEALEILPPLLFLAVITNSCVWNKKIIDLCKRRFSEICKAANSSLEETHDILTSLKNLREKLLQDYED